MTKQAASARGWNELDIVLITGDAYVDHPAFGTAVIGRVLEAAGYRVGIIAMPDWKDAESIAVLGKPRLFFGVASGNVDSMLAQYTAFKKIRSDDPYAPGGKAGRKPERAVIVYCNLIKKMYKDAPIVIGGIEASMRRLPHYDYWSDKMRRSILEDSRASILVYGMGEAPILEIAERINANQSLDGIAGTVTLEKEPPANAVLLPSEEEVMAYKEAYLEATRIFYTHPHQILAQPTAQRFLIHNPPDKSITSKDLDDIFALPFEREPHPSYTETIPAFEMIRHSVISHRGCISGCSFCSLGLHQGRRIVSRSPQSVAAEVRRIAKSRGFTGHITDVGGPSANMYGFECDHNWICKRESCLFPDICIHLNATNWPWLKLLKQTSRISGVDKVTVGSGIRYDLFMKDPEHVHQLTRLLRYHVSGQLKIAPESMTPHVLDAMRKKPHFDLKTFIHLFREINLSLKKRQYLVPYFMSGHPGANVKNTEGARRQTQALFGMIPEQVQTFIPLPMTISSVIYYTGRDPLTGEQYPSVRVQSERRKLHELFTKKQNPSERIFKKKTDTKPERKKTKPGRRR